MMFRKKKAVAPADHDIRATRLHARLQEVAAALDALETAPGALERCFTKLFVAPDPWDDRANLGELTGLVARHVLAGELLSGMLGEHDLVAGIDDFTVGAVRRGLVPPLSPACQILINREQQRRDACRR